MVEFFKRGFTIHLFLAFALLFGFKLSLIIMFLYIYVSEFRIVENIEKLFCVIAIL